MWLRRVITLPRVNGHARLPAIRFGIAFLVVATTVAFLSFAFFRTYSIAGIIEEYGEPVATADSINYDLDTSYFIPSATLELRSVGAFAGAEPGSSSVLVYCDDLAARSVFSQWISGSFSTLNGEHTFALPQSTRITLFELDGNGEAKKRTLHVTFLKFYR